MPELDTLRSLLAATNTHFNVGRFGETKSMGRMAEALELALGAGRAPDPEIVLKTLRAYMQTGFLSTYRDVKNTCFGLLVPVIGKRTVVSSLELLEQLLGQIDGFVDQTSKLKRCYQALLSTYLSLDACDVLSEHHAQWTALRQKLAAWLPKVNRTSPMPDWLAAVLEHENLLGADPTGRYGVEVLSGKREAFDAMCSRLNIGPLSWVRRRVVISSVEVAEAETDARFCAHLDRLIDLLNTNVGVRQEGAVRLLNRYARQKSTPENHLLRAFAVDVLGNPLITVNTARWFEVSEDAREMVAAWLKGFLIERFFELLSHDGHTDRRRPEYWMRYRSSIDNIWFILGATAMRNWNEDFRKLRQTMGNQSLSLDGSTANNNAFAMKIGDLFVVEFGQKGHATFFFDKNTLPFDLAQRALPLFQLKSPKHVNRLTHLDGRESWETRFSEAMAGYGVYPDKRPFGGPESRHQNTAPSGGSAAVESPFNPRLLKKFCNERGLRYSDDTRRGRFIVFTDTSNNFVSRQLSLWGFAYDREDSEWIISL